MFPGNTARIGSGGTVKPPIQLVNRCSTSGWTPASIAVAGAPFAISDVGYLAGGVLKPALSVTGSGVINVLGVATSGSNGSAKTLRMRLTVDDVVVLDSTAVVTASANFGGFAIGGAASFEAVQFNTGFVFEVAATEGTGGGDVNALYKYQVNA